jgi:hypothetical protein
VQLLHRLDARRLGQLIEDAVLEVQRPVGAQPQHQAADVPLGQKIGKGSEQRGALGPQDLYLVGREHRLPGSRGPAGDLQATEIAAEVQPSGDHPPHRVGDQVRPAGRADGQLVEEQLRHRAGRVEVDELAGEVRQRGDQRIIGGRRGAGPGEPPDDGDWGEGGSMGAEVVPVPAVDLSGGQPLSHRLDRLARLEDGARGEPVVDVAGVVGDRRIPGHESA